MKLIYSLSVSKQSLWYVFRKESNIYKKSRETIISY